MSPKPRPSLFLAICVSALRLAFSAATATDAKQLARDSYPDVPWDERIDPACCPYPEHDPRDYNWPFSHFQYSEVIPDVIGTFVAMTDLNVTYDDGADVEYGKRLSPSVLARPPAVAFGLEPDRDDNTLHTLMMVDPDVPFRDAPTSGQHLHWLVYDIQGNDTASGKTLVEYQAPQPQPCPPDGTATSERQCLPEHRVTFILWEQPHGPLALHQEDKYVAAAEEHGRLRYKARDFAARHRLGMHIGMNFFETWHDRGDGTFYDVPWWYVRDERSLVALSHLVPHVERSGGPQTRNVPSSSEGDSEPRKLKKDEL